MRDQKKLLYWIWLSLCFPPDCERLSLLLEQTDPETFYQQRTTYPFLRPGDYRAFGAVSLERAQAAIDRCKQIGADIITLDDDDYPESLKHIECPPPVLYVRGTLAPLQGRLVVAAVGTRHSYEYYNSVVGNISYQLAKTGAVVVSGCAVGNDFYAHYGCIRGRGPTVGVLACGIDVDYPRENHDLKELIVKTGGALISELPPGTPSPKGYFHSRNRLIAGLADCLLLGQVPLRSGAMITATAAVDQGKDIFCIPPSSLYDAQCVGVAEYIRDGARIVFSAYDIVMEYKDRYISTLRIGPLEQKNLLTIKPGESNDMALPANRSKRPPSPKTKEKAHKEPVTVPAAPEKPAPETREVSQPIHVAAPPAYHMDSADPRTKVLSLLSDEPCLLDDLLARCEMPLQDMLQILTGLELEGVVEALSGQRYRLA